MSLFRFCFCLNLKYQYITKIEKTKSKKIGRLRKGARENSKIPQSFLFRISLNKKRQQESGYKQIVKPNIKPYLEIV